MEIRRPRLLRGISSAALLHDGTRLWLGTYSYSEGGDWPAIGVVRYDWENDRLVPEPDAMCGFLAKGMIQLGNVLWLASDGGLSRRDPSGRWEYLVFREIAPPQLRKVTCPEVYDLARTTVGSDHRPGFDDRLEMFRKQREQVRPGR